MKNLLIVFFLFAGLSASAQVTQADFTALFAQFKPATMENYWVNNDRTFFNDGSNKLGVVKYSSTDSSIEAKATAVYIRWYTDDTKTTVRAILIIPYKSILSVTASAKNLNINQVAN